MSRHNADIPTTRSLAVVPPNANLDPTQVAALAYQLWVQRGRPVGSDKYDWFRAEEELRRAEAARPGGVRSAA